MLAGMVESTLSRTLNRSQPAPKPAHYQFLARLTLMIAVAGLGVGARNAQAQSETPTNSPAGKHEPLTLRILDPKEADTATAHEYVNVLGRVSPDARVTVAGQAARVFVTGIFVRDQVPLQIGENAIAVIATSRAGQKIERVLHIRRRDEPAPAVTAGDVKLNIDPQSIEPAESLCVIRGDILEVSFRGTPGQLAEYSLTGNSWTPMAEITDEGTNQPPGLYRASLVIGTSTETVAAPVHFRLKAKTANAAPGQLGGPSPAEAVSKGKLTCWSDTELRLARVKEEGASIAFGLHEVRLGGPFLSELETGTVVRVTGAKGNSYRIRLCPELEGWIEKRDVEWAPAGTAVPHLAFTTISAYGKEGTDFVAIPYSPRVPFSITPECPPDGRASLAIDFFGAHHAATWLSHRSTARLIREVTVNQAGTDHVQVRVQLKDARLWGYRWSITNDTLLVAIRPPTKPAGWPHSPLKNLVVALEPGHGGNNVGARGFTGLLEKDVNRLAVAELARQLKAAGAKPIVLRQDDENPSLRERARRAAASDATLLLSIHANSAGHERGYLAVSGVSTYYKWSSSRDLAESLHRRLLRHTGLADFGNVGNFNYYPIRATTWMPAALVEQAFLSNPEDEAKLLDPKFRQRMMHAVVLGVKDWLKESTPKTTKTSIDNY